MKKNRGNNPKIVNLQATGGDKEKVITNCVIKIFLPREIVFKSVGFLYLYGHKKTETIVNENDSSLKEIISYFIFSYTTELVAARDDFVGTYGIDLSGIKKHRRELEIVVDPTGVETTMLRVWGSSIPFHHQVMMFHYEIDGFGRCYNEHFDPVDIDDNFSLYIAQMVREQNEDRNGKASIDVLTSSLHIFLISFTKFSSYVLKFASPIFRNTMIYRHCSSWRNCLEDKRSRNGFVLLDIMLGLIFCYLMSDFQYSGKYFMDLTELIVNKLRGLLEMLDGSPVGLKLNVQLNNFLLGCFIYHVDLWWNFIEIVGPAIHYLFFPVTMFGLMGFSFQCAMLCDVITLITLHAHCFYIYAAMLYKLELSGIRSLLRIVLGRRLNVLKSEFACLLVNFRLLCLYLHRTRRVARLHQPSAVPRHAVLHDSSFPSAHRHHLLFGVRIGKYFNWFWPALALFISFFLSLADSCG